MIYISVFLSILFCAAYAMFMFWCIAGWRTRETKQSAPDKFQFISVIVPARNEMDNISRCLESICNQDYPQERMEVLVVDDHSTDSTSAEVAGCEKRFPGLVRLLRPGQNEGGSKKEVLSFGVKHARGEYILTTDADCIVPNGWLKQFDSAFRNNEVQMVAAPVGFTGSSIFEKIQSLEMMGLSGIAGAAINHRLPLLCNGANLGFRKKVFDEVGGYEKKKRVISGDDSEMMYKVHAKYPEGITYLGSREATVYTAASRNMFSFLNQRRRWASKIPVAVSGFTLLIAIVAWCAHAFLLFVIAQSYFYPQLRSLAMIALGMKLIPEFVFLFGMSGFFGKRDLLWLMFPAQPFYWIYIVIIGIGSPFAGFSWKGRSHRSAVEPAVNHLKND